LGDAGPSTIGRKGGASALATFLRQFRSPLILILIFAAVVSGFVGEGSEAIIIGISYAKVDEIPYDFIRKRLSVVVRVAGQAEDLMICKGSVQNIVDVCSSVIDATSALPLDEAQAKAIDDRLREWSMQGYRVLGLAVRRFSPRESYRREDESDLAFAGFMLFLDPPKSGIAETLKALAGRGIKVKVITGDNCYAAEHLAESIGLPHRRVLTGMELSNLTKEACSALSRASTSSPKSTPTRKNASLRRFASVATSSAISATASTTRRRCTRPTSAFPSTARWTWRGRRPT
jgi:magnesium-transporting ATPase (P-type)